MNILYDCFDPADKTPFGPVWSGQTCHMRIRIPSECGASRVILTAEGLEQTLEKQKSEGDYDFFAASLAAWRRIPRRFRSSMAAFRERIRIRTAPRLAPSSILSTV